MPHESTSTLPGPSPQAWNRLAEAAGNIFATHTWARCWWEVYGGDATPYVVCDDEADPRVILPLYTRGRLLRRTRLIGHGPADLLGPAGAVADHALVAPLVEQALAEGAIRTDVLLLQDCQVDAPWYAALGGATVRRESSPVLDLAAFGSWEDYLASRSRNFRSQVRRRARNLERDHDVVYRLATAETLERDLDDLLDLHDRRWDGATPLADASQQRFTRAFVAAAAHEGWLRLRTLHLDGRCAAGYLGFNFAGHEYYYQFGRDPGLDADSVGMVLLSHALQGAMEEGSTEFRFLRGDEGYKERFAPRGADVRTIAAPQTLRGRATVAAVTLRRRSELDRH